jgi:hypothetical protein
MHRRRRSRQRAAARRRCWLGARSWARSLLCPALRRRARRVRRCPVRSGAHPDGRCPVRSWIFLDLTCANLTSANPPEARRVRRPRSQQGRSTPLLWRRARPSRIATRERPLCRPAPAHAACRSPFQSSTPVNAAAINGFARSRAVPVPSRVPAGPSCVDHDAAVANEARRVSNFMINPTRRTRGEGPGFRWWRCRLPSRSPSAGPGPCTGRLASGPAAGPPRCRCRVPHRGPVPPGRTG